MSTITDYEVIILGAGAAGSHCGAELVRAGLGVAIVDIECTVKGVDLVRGAGRIIGPGVVDVDGVRHTARNIVVATGSEPGVPPVPALVQLDGVRDARSMTDPYTYSASRLLILGGGPHGVETAQAVHRRGGRVVVVETAEHVLPREPAPLGAALGNALRRDGVELELGARIVRVRHEGSGFRLDIDDGRELKGDRLLTATDRRPHVNDLGLESVGIEPDPYGIAIDTCTRAGEGVWAIGSVTGISPLRSVAVYQADVAAANIRGEPRTANYEAVPRVVGTEPRAVAVGATAGRFSGSATNGDVLTLLSDGTRLTGAYALAPDADAWVQQLTLAIRARVPLPVLYDTIQSSRSFFALYGAALRALRTDIESAP